MPKTPDEIKKGLECVADEDGGCSTCPYRYEEECKVEATKDALALIQQLQAENTEKDERIQQLEAENKQYHQENTEMYLEMCMLREKVHRLEATVSEKENAVDELSRKIG